MFRSPVPSQQLLSCPPPTPHGSSSCRLPSVPLTCQVHSLLWALPLWPHLPTTSFLQIFPGLASFCSVRFQPIYHFLSQTSPTLQPGGVLFPSPPQALSHQPFAFSSEHFSLSETLLFACSLPVFLMHLYVCVCPILSLAHNSTQYIFWNFLFGINYILTENA